MFQTKCGKTFAGRRKQNLLTEGFLSRAVSRLLSPNTAPCGAQICTAASNWKGSIVELWLCKLFPIAGTVIYSFCVTLQITTYHERQKCLGVPAENPKAYNWNRTAQDQPQANSRCWNLYQPFEAAIGMFGGHEKYSVLVLRGNHLCSVMRLLSKGRTKIRFECCPA